MIQPIGHFRVWRELYSKPIWLNSTIEQQVILMTLMAMANFKPKEWEWQGEKYTVEAGQFITSLDSIVARTGGTVSIQNVRTALKRFEKLGFLTNESTKTGRLVTLVNWRDYQYTEEEANIDTNKDLTKTQQRPNKDLTPREEGNKVKKVKKVIKDIYGEFEKVSLSEEEYIKLLERLGQAATDDLIARLDNYKASTGKAYKSDYATILNWSRKELKESGAIRANDKGTPSKVETTGNDIASRAGVQSF